MLRMLVFLICLGWAVPAATGEVSIGTLRTRDHDVRISAGDPPRYTVTDRHGRVLMRGATIEQVARRFPDVHRALKRGLAGREDATLR